jgi:hypothetical protein
VPGKHSQVSGPLRKGLGTSLQVQAPVCGPLIFFEVMLSPFFDKKKKDDLSSILVDDASSIIPQNPAIVVVEKIKFLFFQPKNPISNHFFTQNS